MDSKRNERAMHTGMRAGEIQALTVDDLGEDEIYVRRSCLNTMASNVVKTAKNALSRFLFPISSI